MGEGLIANRYSRETAQTGVAQAEEDPFREGSPFPAFGAPVGGLATGFRPSLTARCLVKGTTLP